MDKQLVAQMRFNYAGRALEVGEQFTASDTDADLFVKLGRARVGKAAKAEPVEEVEGKPVKGVTYDRKDLRAK